MTLSALRCLRFALAAVCLVMGIAQQVYSAELVLNGDFSANAASFGTFPGYFGGANPVSAPNWTGGSGINGTSAPGTGSPFAPATNVPSFLFMQGDLSATQALGTVNGNNYLFSFDAAARNGNLAGVSVFADDTQPASAVLDASFGWLSQSAFQRYAFGFTATGAQTIKFDSSGIDDHTTDITNVSVTDAVPGLWSISNGTMFFTETSGTQNYAFSLTGSNQAIYRRPGSATYTGNITTDGSGGALTITAREDAGGNNLTFSGSTITLGTKNFIVTGQTVDGEGESANSKVTLTNATLTTDGNVDVGRGTLELTGTTSLTIGGQLRAGAGGDWSRFVMGPGTSVVATGGVDFQAVSVIASSMYLNGGTLTTPSITGNVYAATTQTVFNGTTVIASASNADFLNMRTDGGAAHSAAALVANGGAIFDTNGNDITIANSLADLAANNGTLTKQGNGILTLTLANTYSGGTTVTGGTLLVNNTTGSGVGTGNVTINGGTLGGTGTIGLAGDASNVSFGASGGKIAPGASPGILTVNGDVNFNSGSGTKTFEVELSGNTAGTQYDQLLINTATGGADLVDLTGGTLSALFSGSGWGSGLSKLWIINNQTGGSLLGEFNGLPNGALVTTHDGHSWHIVYGANFANGDLFGGNDVVLIPEPGTLAMALFGMIGFLMMGQQRSRQSRKSGAP